MSRLFLLGLGALFGIQAGCADTGTLPRVSPSTSGPREYSPGQPDPEPMWPVKIHSTSGNIELPGFEPYPATMSVYGYMHYNAYHARIAGKLAVSGRNSSSQDFFPKERHSPTFFDNGFHAYWDALLGGPCGNVLQADLEFTAWWIGPGGWIMDENKEQRTVHAEQPPCRTSSGGGSEGGGGGGGGTMTCYTETVDHYWYYPDSGRMEYRYTSEYQWCEPKEYAN